MSSLQYHHAVRLLCIKSLHKEITAIDQIINMEDGPNKYDAKDGFVDIGVSKTGLNIVKEAVEDYYFYDPLSYNNFKVQPSYYQMRFRIELDEVHDVSRQFEPYDLEGSTFVGLSQDANQNLIAYVFVNCRRCQTDIQFGRGYVVTLECTFSEGKIISRQLGDVISFTDFDAWRKSLPHE